MAPQHSQCGNGEIVLRINGIVKMVIHFDENKAIITTAKVDRKFFIVVWYMIFATSGVLSYFSQLTLKVTIVYIRHKHHVEGH